MPSVKPVELERSKERRAKIRNFRSLQHGILARLVLIPPIRPVTKEEDGTVSLSELVHGPFLAILERPLTLDTFLLILFRSGLMRLRGELHKVDMVIAQMSLDQILQLGNTNIELRYGCGHQNRTQETIHSNSECTLAFGVGCCLDSLTA